MDEWVGLAIISWIGTAVCLMMLYGRRWWVGLIIASLIGAVVILWMRAEVASLRPTDKTGLGALSTIILGSLVLMPVVVGLVAGGILRLIQAVLERRLQGTALKRGKNIIAVVALAPSIGLSALAVVSQLPPSSTCLELGVPLQIGGRVISPPPVQPFAINFCEDGSRICTGWTAFREPKDQRLMCRLTNDGARPIQAEYLDIPVLSQRRRFFRAMKPECKSAKLVDYRTKNPCKAEFDLFMQNLLKVRFMRSEPEDQIFKTMSAELTSEVSQYVGSDRTEFRFRCSPSGQRARVCVAYRSFGDDSIIRSEILVRKGQKLVDVLADMDRDLNLILETFRWSRK